MNNTLIIKLAFGSTPAIHIDQVEVTSTPTSTMEIHQQVAEAMAIPFHAVKIMLRSKEIYHEKVKINLIEVLKLVDGSVLSSWKMGLYCLSMNQLVCCWPIQNHPQGSWKKYQFCQHMLLRHNCASGYPKQSRYRHTL